MSLSNDTISHTIPTNVLPGSPLLPGMPAGAQFQNIRDPSGLLQSNFRLAGDNSGLNILRDRLLSPQNLAGTQQGLTNLDAQLARQESQGAKSLAANRTQALGQGGLLGALKGLGGDFQGINQANQNEIGQGSNLLQKDLQTRGQSLLQLPGQEIAGLGADQFNISQALAERQRESEAKLRDFNTRANVYGASKQSQAILESGADNGLLGLGFLGL